MGTANTTSRTVVDIDNFCSTKLEDPAFLYTGDLLLLSGSGLRSRLIALCTWCKYTHIGIVVLRRDVQPSYTGPNEYYLLESSSAASAAKCICGQTHTGVRLVPMRERLREYMNDSGTGEVYVNVVQTMHQGDPPNGAQCFFGLRVDDCTRLRRFIHTHLSCPHDLRVSDSISDHAIGRLHEATRPSPHGYTCSGLVAAFYVDTKTLSGKLDLASVSPKTFYARDRALATFMNAPSPTCNVTVFDQKNNERCITHTSVVAQVATAPSYSIHPSTALSAAAAAAMTSVDLSPRGDNVALVSDTDVLQF